MVLRSELPISEIKALIETGDIDLSTARQAFKGLFEQETTLSDDDIICCYAAQDDDYGLTDITNRMLALEAGNEDVAFTAGEASEIAPELQQFHDGLLTLDETIGKLDKTLKP